MGSRPSRSVENKRNEVKSDNGARAMTPDPRDLTSQDELHLSAARPPLQQLLTWAWQEITSADATSEVPTSKTERQRPQALDSSQCQNRTDQTETGRRESVVLSKQQLEQPLGMSWLPIEAKQGVSLAKKQGPSEYAVPENK